ncbi:MAG: T9SS type A sorting domain-containing protein, partial [Saprospiraceae bacterium]|nr:T9SS type A sorting domain-containing protein [Saprospiraceae bacterium]
AYQWLFNNQPIPGATGLTYIATQSGVYELETTSANGCRYQSGGITIIISSTALPANVTKFSLAPNPTADQTVLKLELRRTENSTISLTDGQGRTIFSQMRQEQKIMLPIDLRALSAGTYFLTIKTEGGTFVRQIIRQ